MRVTSRKVAIGTAVVTSAGMAAGLAVALPSLAKPDPVLVKVAAASGTPVPGHYIVTLKQGASPAGEAGKVKATQVQRYDGPLNGFAAKLTPAQLAKLQRSKMVAAIEPDQVVKAVTKQKPAPWGLDRIDQRQLPLNDSYRYKGTGRGVTAYVIDTGILATHPQFGGRAKSVWRAKRFRNGRDCNGHGTHVAGIIGARWFGVAKNVRIRSLRTLDCGGSGQVSVVINAVNWLRTHAARPAVVNLSLSAPRSAALDRAVAALSRSGLFVSVAAGNDGADACAFSPSGAQSVMVVGATGGKDRLAPWSNRGRCVDINAPGIGIRSTGLDGKVETQSGTSMASPFVAGVAALYLSTHRRARFAQVERWLVTNSIKNRIAGVPAGTANRLLFKGSL